MRLFWKKHQQEDKERLTFTDKHNSAIEIVAHKNATDEVKADIDDANARLREIFENNHFVVKVLVAGGKNQKRATK